MRTPERVFEWRELAGWSRRGGTWLAVLGYPVRHSISSWMHHAALEELQVRDPGYREWDYLRLEVPPAELPEALQLLHAEGFRGLNLTVPHKVDVLPLLVARDAESAAMGAANTLLWTEAGYRGFNSDGYGLARAVEETFGEGLGGRRVLLLGAGGASRAAAVQLARSEAAAVWVYNRTVAKAEALVTSVHRIHPRSHCAVLADPGDVPEVDLVINATSLGLKGGDASPFPVDRLSGTPACFDMIYNPAQTPFLAEAESRGCPVGNGLPMLVHQGARSLEIWSGESVPVAAMAEGARRGLAALTSGGNPPH